MGHNGSTYDDVIHIALTARDRASQITSFQPPLTATLDVARSIMFFNSHYMAAVVEVLWQIP